MRGVSLRLRLALAGGLAIALALAVAGYGLTLVFERHVYRTLSDSLDAYVREIAGGVEIDASGEPTLPRPPADPRFEAPLSGLYWEVVADGRTLRSRSLWDADLNVPTPVSEGETHYHQVVGPDGKLLLAAERRIEPIGGPPQGVRIIVATDLTRLKAARDAFAADLALSLALLALVLGAATFVQLGLGLRPLKSLSEEVSGIVAGRRARLSEEAPLEVRPLVAEVNALLDAREAELERARGRAADLAHGLKTPLSALMGDAARLREMGQEDVAKSIEAVGEQMRRHVERELARARLRGGAARRGLHATPVAPVVDALFRTLARTDKGAAIEFVNAAPAEATAPFERADLTEVLGNILDNAVRYAKSTVRVSYEPADGNWTIAVEDDGPGVAPETEALIRRRGGRLDQSGGAGLGLAIVEDVLQAYGWRMAFERSSMGGLKVLLTPAKG